MGLISDPHIMNKEESIVSYLSQINENKFIEEAYEIIAALRGNGDPEHPSAKREFQEIVDVVELERQNAKTNYIKMFFGIGSGDVHLGRRIQIAFGSRS